MGTRSKESTIKQLTDLIFKDKSGTIVIGQFPNIPLLAWIVLVLLARVVDGPLADNLALLGSAFGLVWAYLELTAGVNLFRRIIGGIAFILIIFNFLSTAL